MKVLMPFLLFALTGDHTTTLKLRVDRMTCSSCVFTVKRALEKVEGVEKVRVTMQPPEAVVEFNPEKATPKDLVRATKKYGYPSQILLAPPPNKIPQDLLNQKGVRLLEEEGHVRGILVNPEKVELSKVLEMLQSQNSQKQQNTPKNENESNAGGAP